MGPWSRTAGGWRLYRDPTSGSGTVGVADSFNEGDTVTLVAAWTASGLQLSVNGAAFTTATGDPASVTLGDLADLGRLSSGSGAGAELIDSDVLWAAAGTGTLTHSDAATLNGYGDSDPAQASLPGDPGFLWDANTATANRASQTTGYGYDSLGRLDQVLLPSGTCRDYDYDLDSNRTEIQESGTGCAGSFATTATYTYAPAAGTPVDALTGETGPTRGFGYDTDGNMTGRGSDTLSWDGFGRLSGGVFAGTTVGYLYDPSGQLEARSTSSLSRLTGVPQMCS